MSINVENIRILREAILGAPDNFDMGLWSYSSSERATKKDIREHKCGTTACIGGWAEAIFLPDDQPFEARDEEVAAILGITEEQMFTLFYPLDKDYNGYNPYRATNVEVARVLENLIETGEVNWEVAFA